jgi:hypothetical protein
MKQLSSEGKKPAKHKDLEQEEEEEEEESYDSH